MKYQEVLAFMAGLWLVAEISNHIGTGPGDPGRRRYLYPDIDPRLLYKTPTGFCFGRDKKTGRYICYARKPPEGQKELGGSKNVLVNGGSGTGKSTAILIPAILGQSGDEVDAVQLIIDIKKELSEICGRKNDVIFDPQDRYSYGYDPFYALSDSSSTQDIYGQMHLIASCLIPLSKTDDGPWTKAARQLLTGFLVYFFKANKKDDKGRPIPRTLPNLLKMILEKDIDCLVKEIIDTCPPASIPFRFTQHYLKMGADTKMSVDFNLRLRLQELTSDADLVYSLSDNPRKFSPRNLVQHGNGRSDHIYLAVPEDRLEQYGPIIFLILGQTFNYILSLPEAKNDPSRKSIQILIDECSALVAGVGRIEGLTQFLRVCRSKNSQVMILCQSLAGLRCSMSKDEVDDMLSNCSMKVILDASVQDDQKLFSGYCPKYTARKRSYSGSGSNRKVTTSYEQRCIMEPSDFLDLKNEAVFIHNSIGYMRARKVYFFSNPYYMRLAGVARPKSSSFLKIIHIISDTLKSFLKKEEQNG